MARKQAQVCKWVFSQNLAGGGRPGTARVPIPQPGKERPGDTLRPKTQKVQLREKIEVRSRPNRRAAEDDGCPDRLPRALTQQRFFVPSAYLGAPALAAVPWPPSAEPGEDGPCRASTQPSGAGPAGHRNTVTRTDHGGAGKAVTGHTRARARCRSPAVRRGSCPGVPLTFLLFVGQM